MRNIFTHVLTIFAALSLAFTANAQFTTSSLSGLVQNEKGEPMTGATVVAVHVPSGTQYYAIANTEGYYAIQGMRPGGPYEVVVSFVGCDEQKFDNVMLSLGETYNKDVVLKDSMTLKEAYVVATASKFTTEKTGASTNVSNQDIVNLPNASHSIESITKFSPYANGMNFAGTDGRSTNFTVDGANFNNNLGLSSSLPGGGNPISVDALEEVQLVVAPYDVRQSNFVGGGINAITKSGTNKFKVSAYTYYHDEGLRGNKIAGERIGDRSFEQNKIYGATFGGPIVKNKLFFFVNFEMQRQPEQTIKYRANSGSEAAEGLVSRTSVADMQAVYDKLVKEYDYDPGSYSNFPGGISNTRILARIDWNISDNHKFNIRYNTTKNTQWFEPNGNSSDDGFRNKSFNRVGNESMAFANNMYSQNNNVTSVSAEFNSRFGNKVSNQFLATYTDINDMRGTNSSLFPHIDIMQGDNLSNIIAGTGTYSNRPAMSLGYELFSYNTGSINKVITVADNVTVHTGLHKITAGLSWERQNVINSYMRNGSGYYRYASVDDFLNDRMPMSAVLTIGNNGNENPRGELTYNQFGAYAQDEWNVSRKFKLTYGLRADMIVFDNSQLMTNNATLAYDMGGRSVDTGRWPDTRVQISPRVGFIWDVLGDKSLKIRGGVGLFQGRLPLVFFTNMPLNSGMIQTSKAFAYNTDEGNEGLLKLFPGGHGKATTTVKKMAEILGVNTTVTPDKGQFQSTIIGVDSNFRMPQTAKLSVAADYVIPVNFPFTVTAEGMFSKIIYGVCLKDWNINESKLTTRFSGSEDRVDYWALEDINAKGAIVNRQYVYGNATGAYVLSNTREGYGYNVVLSFDMTPARNLNIKGSYIHMESKEISGMPGSNASSAYQGLYTVNGANLTTLQRSQYVIPDKLTLMANYYLEHQGLHFNLYYSAYSPAGYNYIYANDMNGDGNAADLMYIYPTGNEVNFIDHTYTWKAGGKDVTGASLTAAQQAAIYDQFVSQDGYLKRHKGQYAEANAGRSPFVHRVDLRIAKDFVFGKEKKHNIQISASIENIGNMINSSWGVQKWSCYQTSSTVFNITPLTYAGKDSSGKPTYYMTAIDGMDTMPTSTYNKFFVDPTECWQILFGIKYTFN